ncbi:hypothetical protein KIN20_004644 [Parelaphostrongylus tenuis]|uniref:Uncharacterized protein n=1 Tax=Parelaphostrongylus tenuis TaxID=148309 RepID=A0AAD5MK84_PARTN|nr:hypothetical protein KIN20_004644 [Parelaphostrongylus tenuis]
MANGRSTKVGCAYRVCVPNDIDMSDESSWPAFDVSVACTYGDANIEIGVPLYTIGTPCTTCGSPKKDTCILNALCNNSVV